MRRLEFLLLVPFFVALFCSASPTPPKEISSSVTKEAPILPDLSFIPVQFRETVIVASAYYNVPPDMLGRLLYVESKFNPKKVNKNSNGTLDRGLAQLNSDYVAEFGDRYGFGVVDPFNPYQSILIAAKHLSVLYKHTGTWYLSFCAYNAGLRRVLEGRIPTKTKAYAEYIVNGK